MSIPVYSKSDAYNAHIDGEDRITNFEEFILLLIENDDFQNAKEAGIVAFVKNEGTSALSPKQLYVLEKIVSRYNDKECVICGEKIPLNEVFDDNDGYCSYHKYVMDKDD